MKEMLGEVYMLETVEIMEKQSRGVEKVEEVEIVVLEETQN